MDDEAERFGCMIIILVILMVMVTYCSTQRDIEPECKRLNAEHRKEQS